jgi:hypothetical protein
LYKNVLKFFKNVPFQTVGIYFFVEVFPEMQLSDSDNDWVILNLNMSGYYRVNYDKLGWMKLSQQLQRDPKVRLFVML